jgi:hypothetical protein
MNIERYNGISYVKSENKCFYNWDAFKFKNSIGFLSVTESPHSEKEELGLYIPKESRDSIFNVNDGEFYWFDLKEFEEKFEKGVIERVEEEDIFSYSKLL